jgi:hypothetical protein
MSREGRSQPIQPVAQHGFVDPGPGPVGTTPPPVTVVPLIDERRRQYPTIQPIVVSAAQYVTPPAAPNPPVPVIVDRADQRVRYRPLDPTVGHGFDEADPPTPTVVEPPARRSRPTPDPVVLTGALAGLTPVFVAPPPAVVATPVVPRQAPLQPVVLSGGLAGVVVPPTVPPPPPVVVPVETIGEDVSAATTGRAFVDSGVGVPGTTPPEPNVVIPDRPRRLPTDPFVVSGVLLGVPTTTTAVPPGPFVVPLEERRRLLALLPPPSSSHGFLGNIPPNGVLPPPNTNLDRNDQRIRFLPQPSLVLSGALAATIPPPPVTVNAGTDWAAEMSTW